MSVGMSPLEFRKSVRSGKYQGNTSGYCPGYVQGNVVILPSDWAAEFLQFCQFNQKPCPLVAMSEIGDPSLPTLGKELDIRTDLPLYRIFKDGNVVEELPDITNCWRDDFVTFVLGCSFSFEEALMADGLEVRNVMEGVNVPMFRTDIPCRSAGRFNGNMVVSMRPFLAADAIRAVQISTRFPSVHGAPVHLGDPTRIGVQDISHPDFGDAVTIADGEIPVFWACGVTPQVALEQAKPPVCITHSPGCMLVTDLRNSQLALL